MKVYSRLGANLNKHCSFVQQEHYSQSTCLMRLWIFWCTNRSDYSCTKQGTALVRHLHTKRTAVLLQPSTLVQATFAAGCFWSLELAFQRAPGVVSTNVGYSNGDYADPTYDAVCSGTTGHAEAVQVSLVCKLWQRGRSFCVTVARSTYFLTF